MRLLAAALLLAGLTLLLFRTVLVPVGLARYPWSSDALGHVLKAEYLAAGLSSGSYYPDLMPSWYMGLQMLRYYPPLPYYLLVGLTTITGDSITAVHWFIALCAFGGGLSWLLYQRWLGWLPAITGGALFLFLPDNLRVAFAEGNLPRVLATGLLPLTIYCLLRSLKPGGTRWHHIGLMCCFASLVLSHAMMAAIYAVICSVLCVLLLLTRSVSWRYTIHTIGAIILGLLLSGWWLLPSLTGGITELDSSVMTEALAVLPVTHYLNPFTRLENPESIYVGLALILLPVLLLICVQCSRITAVLLLTGLAGILITTPGFNALWNSLPMHHLFWPLRFLGIASFCLLLAIMWRIGSLNGILRTIIIGLLILDSLGSLHLLRLQSLPTDVDTIATQMASTPGWREATLDLSRLGSTTSYAFSAIGQREQIFGWAYQGAHTAKTVAALNEALETQSTAYLCDRLDLYGVDDVVLLNNLRGASTVGQTLIAHGFNQTYTGTQATYYVRMGAPRAFHARWPALGIGKGSQNLAYLFPNLITATSPYLDDYTLEELQRYQTIVLAGFTWHNRTAAEELVRAAARHGVRILIDLTGIPEDPWARQPVFLDVWGEKVVLDTPPVIKDNDHSYRLRSFDQSMLPWYTHTLQGLDYAELSFDYLGEHAAVLGYRSVGDAKIWFIGLNLPYHAALTSDPVAVQWLSSVLKLTPHHSSSRSSVSLTDYHADQRGYRFRYTLNQPERLFVPMAAFAGTRVFIDGQMVAVHSFERLLAFDAPAGTHQVHIDIEVTPVYYTGIIISLLSFAILLRILLVRYDSDSYAPGSDVLILHQPASKSMLRSP